MRLALPELLQVDPAATAPSLIALCISRGPRLSAGREPKRAPGVSRAPSRWVRSAACVVAIPMLLPLREPHPRPARRQELVHVGAGGARCKRPRARIERRRLLASRTPRAQVPSADPRHGRLARPRSTSFISISSPPPIARADARGLLRHSEAAPRESASLSGPGHISTSSSSPNLRATSTRRARQNSSR